QKQQEQRRPPLLLPNQALLPRSRDMAIEQHIPLHGREETFRRIDASSKAKSTGGVSMQKKGRRSTFSVVSLFSGCGGMDLGFMGGFEFLGKKFSKLPFEIVWANEINSAACRTYRRNIGAHIHEGDIWSMFDRLPASADVVIGGFPCQDISVNGKGAGLNGKRSSLYRAMVEVVARVKPKVFVAENVKGLLMKHHADA